MNQRLALGIRKDIMIGLVPKTVLEEDPRFHFGRGLCLSQWLSLAPSHVAAFVCCNTVKNRPIDRFALAKYFHAVARRQIKVTF